MSETSTSEHRRVSPRQTLPLVILVLALGWLSLRVLQTYRQAQHFPGLPPVVPLAADKTLGVSVDLTQYEAGALETQLNLMEQAGLTWLRQPFRWADLEPRPGRFQWEAIDRIVQATRERNFKLIAVLNTSPAWARPAGTSATTPPTEVSDLGRFAKAVAERYGAWIDVYQIWHEPNLSANWGDAFVDPVGYTWLLRDAAVSIRAADPESFILSAALAPTTEAGPLNLNDPLFLETMYQAGAGEWFDGVAAQAYGFDQTASLIATRPDQLNFARPLLLRQVMLAHGDEQKPVWLSAFGWNALPADWTGQTSPWKSLPPARAVDETETALHLARTNWPWLGPMVLIRWDSAGLAATDPARGFALVDDGVPSVFFDSLERRAKVPDRATVGFYPAAHASGHYSSGWRITPSGSDVPRPAASAKLPTLTIPFEGTRLDLLIRRGRFKGFLWVTIDGHPANALPRDMNGHSYVVLYDPLAEKDWVTLARDLADGSHQVEVRAEGGWDQWAIAGWRVGREAPRPAAWTFYLAGTAGLLAAAVLAFQYRPRLPRLPGSSPAGPNRAAFRLPRLRPWATTFQDQGLPFHFLIAAILVAAFYLSPHWLLTLAILALLGLHILLQPRLGLAIIAFSLSFFLITKPLPGGNFSLVEVATLLTAATVVVRWGWQANHNLKPTALARGRPAWPLTFQWPFKGDRLALTWLDLGALAFVALALAATLAAQNYGVSMREFRVVVFEPVLFYFLIRLVSLGRNQNPLAEASFICNAFLAGVTLHAGIALYQYFFTGQVISAEGVRRALGLYGSPNNLALVLARALPLQLALTLWGSGKSAGTGPGSAAERWLPRWLRLLYALSLVTVALALYLTFSKGALLLGIPAALAVLLILGGLGRRRTIVLGIGGVFFLVAALIPLLGTERFRSLVNLSPGSTGFFRLRLWQSGLAMLSEHPWLGVGLDNFLYQYRTRYIQPDAWQEPNLSHPHNFLLDFGTRLGLGGILLIGWLQWGFWQAALRAYRRLGSPLATGILAGLMASMATFLFHGLVDNSYFLVDLAFIFFMSLALIQSLATVER
jgi:O-antigen ligase